MKSTIDQQIGKLAELEHMFNSIDEVYEYLKLEGEDKRHRPAPHMRIEIDFDNKIFGFEFVSYLRRYLVDKVNITKANLKYELEHDLKLNEDQEVLPNE